MFLHRSIIDGKNRHRVRSILFVIYEDNFLPVKNMNDNVVNLASY